MLTALLKHLGAGATSPAPPEDHSALDEFAQKQKEAREAQIKRLFKDGTDELTEEGRELAENGWMHDGLA